MIKAAGILYLTPADQALFLKRGAGSDHPMEWSWPGGQLEGEEGPLEAALRESLEECGFAPEAAALSQHTRSVAPAISQPPMPEGVAPTVAPSEDVDFTTYVCRVPEPFAVTLCDEHTGYAWASVAAPPEPLHPGCRVALDRLAMNELGVARAMAAGQLSSPQRYENVWLFTIRITGTGVSYRPSIKEYVWRPPEVWMNDDALARCNGLAVIWEHPDKSKVLMDGKEFNDRVVGTVFLPFLRPEVGEVWAVAKIYDDEAADDMAHKGISTSPAVNFPPGVNTRIVVEGKKMLLEAEPSLLDHIAVCTAGVWDKGGEPSGVESTEILAVSDDATAPPATSPLALAGLAVAAFRLNIASRSLSGRR